MEKAERIDSVISQISTVLVETYQLGLNQEISSFYESNACVLKEINILKEEVFQLKSNFGSPKSTPLKGQENQSTGKHILSAEKIESSKDVSIFSIDHELNENLNQMNISSSFAFDSMYLFIEAQT